MTPDELKNLGTGDLVRHKTSSRAALVTANYGDHAVAVQTHHITNPDEWLLVFKADYNIPRPDLSFIAAAKEAEKVLTRLRDRGTIADAPVIRQLATALRGIGQ